MLVREPFQFFIVDITRIFTHAVLHKVIEPAAFVDLMPVGQVTAMVEVHRKHGVARLNQRLIGGEVCLRACVRLDIRVFRAKEFLRALDRDRLHHIHIFAAAVIAFARISFRVFVGQRAAHGCEHSGRHKVFRGDELDVVALAAELQLHCVTNLGVKL